MSKRQSVRSTRCSVNYSKLNRDSDSEDDFATSTPPTKKARIKQKKSISPLKKKQKNKRLPDKAEDKFSRELEKAVKLSLASQQSSDCDQTETQEFKPSPCVPGETSSPLRQNVAPPDKPQSPDCRVSDDNIRTEVNITKGKDKDYELSDNPSSDDPGSDQSIENQPPTKTKKVVSRRKVEIVSKNFANKKEKSHYCDDKNKSKRATSREVYKLSPTNTFSQPRWQPPGQAGSPASRNNLLRSPASLRIGLSRNVRPAPLHKT